MNFLKISPYSYGLRRTVMRINLIIILMTMGFLHVSAGVDAQQKITLSLKEADIKQAFDAIEKQSGYGFWFEKEQLSAARRITLKLQDVSLKEALDECFKGQPLTYEIVDKTIVVKGRAVAPAPVKIDEVTRATVRGRVTDKKGLPLIGVSVRVKGTNAGTITDQNGRYSLEADPQGVIVFSYLGFQTMEIRINGQSEIDMTLVDNDTQLDQVQVIAYGTTSRRLSTGNIGSVRAEEIARQPVSNPLLALQGRIPGLYVQQQNGIPGGNVTVRIQGQNSLTKGSDPFYVVDGVPFSSDQLPGTSSGIRGGTGGSGSPLNYLNPNDIESIEVLKDADATSIYGSRAANGAILITTKKGVAGATKLDLSLQTGWSKVPRFVDLMSTSDYIKIRREGKINDNDLNFSQDYDINGTWDTTRYTDWQKQLIGNTSKYTNLQATVSGGSGGTQFLVGAGFSNETMIFYGGNDQPNYKGSFNFKMNHTSLSKRFNLQFSGNYVSVINNMPSRDLTFTAWTLPPNAPELFNPDGSINWEPLASGVTTFNNPVGDLFQKYKVNTNSIIGNLLVGYLILPGLEFKSSFGYTNLYGNDISTTPITSFRPDATNPLRSARSSRNSNLGWIMEPQLQFKTKTDIGSFDVLVGSTFQDNKRDFLALTASGFTSDEQLENLAVASTITITSAVQSRYKYNALFGRVNYNFDNKYLLNISVRRDGSSRFGSENLFNNFASIGGAWVFSEEEFIRRNMSFLSFGKLKVSYGTTGNDQIGDYQFLNRYDKVVAAVVPYQGVVGLAPQGHANPYLQWEETRKTNIGLDLGFLKDQILVSANYFKNQSSNQLLAYVLPFQTGFSSVQSNFPAVIRNSGWEMQLDARIFSNSHFSWNSSFNLTIAKNKLVDFPGLASNPNYSNKLIIGKPITGSKVYQYAGVNQTTGFYEVINAKGEKTSTPSSLTDQTSFINTTPKFYGGLSNQFQVKGFEIDIFFQFVSLTQSNFSMRFGGGRLGTQNNAPSSLLGRWRATGDIVDVQKPSATSITAITAYTAATLSDEAYSDGSFLRLKNVSVSYRIPHQLLRNVLKQEPRVFVQGQNLYTFTNFTGFDPENGGAGALPPLRTISTGIQLTF